MTMQDKSCKNAPLNQQNLAAVSRQRFLPPHALTHTRTRTHTHTHTHTHDRHSLQMHHTSSEYRQGVRSPVFLTPTEPLTHQIKSWGQSGTKTRFEAAVLLGAGPGPLIPTLDPLEGTTDVRRHYNSSWRVFPLALAPALGSGSEGLMKMPSAVFQ